MARNVVASRCLVVFSILALAMVIAPAVTSLPTGISGIKDSGCNCHGTDPSDSVVPSIGGLPESYNASETYTVTVSFTGGPSTDGNKNLGGFNLWASAGTFTVSDSDVRIWSPNEVSHSYGGIAARKIIVVPCKVKNWL